MHTKPIFTVDWEPYFCYLPYCSFWEENDPLVEEPTYYLLDLLRRHKVKAVWYVLGWMKDKREDLFNEIVKEGHVIGHHTYKHTYDNSKEKLNNPLFRSPRFQGQKRLYSGGFWFRAMPYWWSKNELRKSGVFYIHPHDLLGLDHPYTGSPFQDFKRFIGSTTVRDKLERLLREVEFIDASALYKPTVSR